MNIPFIAFTQREEVKTLLEKELLSLTGNKPLIYQNVSDLKTFISLFPKLQFLLLDISEESFDLKKFKNEIIQCSDKFDHLIFVESDDSEGMSFTNFSRDDFSGLVSYLKEVVLEIKESPSNWVSVPLSVLSHFKKLPCDIYLKISDKKFVKRLKRAEAADEHLLRNFELRGIHEVWVASANEAEFMKELMNQLLSSREMNFKSATEKLKTRCDIFESTKKLIHSFDLNPRIFQVCQGLIRDIYQDVSVNHSRAASYLNSLRENQEYSFHYRFINLSAFLAGHLLTALDVKDYAEKLKIVISAAFFSDISLSEPEFIHHIQADMQKEFEEQNNVEVLTHAWKAYKMISSSLVLPVEVAQVIKQHHGSTEGFGFPKNKKSARLSNLSKCLIISQEIAYHILVYPQKNLFEVLEMTTKKHDEFAAKRIISLFETLLESKEDVKAS